VLVVCRRLESGTGAYGTTPVGICGGAKLAGRSTDYIHTPFDLLSGTEVHYDCGVNAAMVDVKTDATKDVVHLTTGCAIAVLVTPDVCCAVSFPCIKNKEQWLPFAAENSVALQRWVEVKASQQCTTLWRCNTAFTCDAEPPAEPLAEPPCSSDLSYVAAADVCTNAAGDAIPLVQHASAVPRNAVYQHTSDGRQTFYPDFSLSSLFSIQYADPASSRLDNIKLRRLELCRDNRRLDNRRRDSTAKAMAGTAPMPP